VPGGWRIDERTGGASSLRAAWPEVERHPGSRALAVCRVAAPALVLGSTQAATVVDGVRCAASGIDVVHRRSGGGAVLVTPEDPVWIDAWVPVGDPLWRSDVGRAFDWLGDSWVQALGRSGITGVSAHRRGYVPRTPWSTAVCFGGVGAGEVVTDDGRKLVGLAQRRNRHGAWFHGACVLRWDPGPLVDLLVLSEAERESARAGLAGTAVGADDLADELGVAGFSQARLTAALISSLP
jgi:lipoate---protein ligase